MSIARIPTPPLYDPSYEHDGCGTGFIANISGERTHRIVELAVLGVVNLTHRGAVSADAASGDGAGVTIQIPHELLAEEARRLGITVEQPEDLAVAMTFLPPDEAERPRARELLEQAARKSGLDVLGWRPVPLDPSVLGGLALDALPGIEQLLLTRSGALQGADYERALYLARRRAARAFREQDIACYAVSMSPRTV
ncbi:MAG: glutamate synthase subunit alpha, partial [Proteobacteria bacterium]|nr:glutamate synthase subunit alpha [Pseudomonadota bacterium]